MKVYELGKELGVKSSVITDILNDGSDKKIAPVSNLTDEQINNVILKIDEEKTKKEQEEKEKKSIRKDSDYRPDEMIPCHSVFPGVLHFYGKHTGMTYKFVGAGDRRNIEYQDLKAAMLEHTDSLFNPDVIIDDENLVNDEHWYEIKNLYENMFDENDIKKIMSLPTSDFRIAFQQLPSVAKETIISMYATQIENGTFEQYNKAKIIDDICGTRFDLKM